MDIPLDEVIHVEAISSSSTGAAADADSTPTFAVYEESTDTDVGVGGNMTKRTSLTGNYRASFTASAANGFDVGKWYSVIGSATIGGIATKGVLARFRIVAAEATAGYPVTTHKVGTGTGELSTSSGVVKADDFNGNHLLYLDYYDSYTRLTSGTVAAGAAGTVTLAAGASSVDDFYKGRAISIISGTGVGQTRVCTAYNGTTKVATISPNWATNPSAGATYYIGLLDASSVPQTGDCFALIGTAGAGLTSVGVGPGGITNASLAADTGMSSIRSNTAQAGTSSTITLDASASATNDFYTGRWIRLTGGTGSGQVRLITAYNGSTKVATVATWATAPDNTTTFAIINAANILLVGTLTTYTGNTPQTGDAYAIVNSGTHGNAALKTLIDAVDNFIDTEVDDIRTRVLLALPAVASGSAGGLATYSDQLAIQAALVTIFNDTDELQQDWTNGGRLDLLVDSIIATLGSAGAGLTAITDRITDIYHADIYYTRDDAGSTDEYNVSWLKNGVRVSSGITSPTIQVIKRADGTNLIASTAMTEIGSTGSYKYTASGAERQTAGESCVVVVAATIDASSRSFIRSLGRDSSA